MKLFVDFLLLIEIDLYTDTEFNLYLCLYVQSRLSYIRVHIYIYTYIHTYIYSIPLRKFSQKETGRHEISHPTPPRKNFVSAPRQLQPWPRAFCPFLAVLPTSGPGATDRLRESASRLRHLGIHFGEEVCPIRGDEWEI